MKFPHIIAHRGASAYAPENTMAAFEKAHAMGAVWVETDVMLTKDLIPILHHDDSLKRTTSVNKLVQNCTFAEIEQYDAGSFFSPDFEGEKIPRLDTLLTFLMKHNMGLNLEIKPTLNMEADTARIAMQTLIDSGFPKSKLLITSFSLRALEIAYAYAPNYHYGWLSDNDRNMNIGLASNIPFVTVNINEPRANESLVTTLLHRGYQVLCFTIDDPKRAEALFEMGVAAVFSNIPNLTT